MLVPRRERVSERLRAWRPLHLWSVLDARDLKHSVQSLAQRGGLRLPVFEVLAVSDRSTEPEYTRQAKSSSPVRTCLEM